jgi:SAM-dependent methyltransferase
MRPSRLPKRIERILFNRRGDWSGSTSYWQDRYERDDNSGAGSYGRLARFKADFVNSLVADRGFQSVLELGCGDGNQVSLARYPSYVGVDVSPAAVSTCRRRFAGDLSKRFIVAGEEPLPACEVGLSLDVIYHLVEDAVFERYMADLLDHSEQCVVLYTSDRDVYTPPRREPRHIRHRPVQAWIRDRRPDWRLRERVPNPHPWKPYNQKHTSFADFYVFDRTG